MPDTYYNESFYSDGSPLYRGMGYDENENFVYYGKGKVYNKGKIIEEGYFSNNDLNGYGKVYVEGRLFEEGYFVNGELNGYGRVYIDNELYEEGDFVDGKLNGYGIRYISNEICEKGEFIDGELISEGEKEINYVDNSMYVGDCIGGVPNGYGKKYDKYGNLKFEGYFADGMWNGTGTFYYDDGKFLKGFFANNAACGKCIYYNSYGSFISEYNYKNGFAVTANETNFNLDKCISELNSLIGLKKVKEQVNSEVNMLKLQKERQRRGMPNMTMSRHMVFTGNPGTGKTTVARIIGKIYASLGILSKGQFVEVDRGDLIGEYTGWTAQKTEAKLNEAKGGILFIDEAYSLVMGNGDSFGLEAINTILKYMEDNRGDLLVIVAGYEEEMNKFLESNPGMKSRFNNYIDFENYSIEELMQIFRLICAENGFIMYPATQKLFEANLKSVMNYNKTLKRFSNGRYIRNLFEKLIFAQGNRFSKINITAANDEDLTELSIHDLEHIIENEEFERQMD